jgi:MscS family membrane protein
LNLRKLRLPRDFLSQKRVTCLRAGASLLCLILLVGAPVWAQFGIPTKPASVQPQVPKDSLGRTTPRGTVLGFFIAARDGKDGLAAQYLNTHLSGYDAAVLAHQLFIVMDRRLPARLNELSDKPEGSLSNLLDPDQELVGTIRSDNGNVDIFVERVDRGKSGPLWLFSSKTLDSIPDLYDEINVVSVYDILPEFLVKTRFAGIALFEWLAVLVGLPLLYLLSGLLSRPISRSVGLLRRWYKKPDLPDFDFLPTPVRLLLVAFVVRWTISKISLPLLARQFWSGLATVITYAAIVWLLILLASWGEGYARRLSGSHHLTGFASVLRLARWMVDLLIIFTGAVMTLGYFRVNVTAALAGLGVGGIAVALAAQKTTENIIAGISLICDQAVRVGDTLKLNDRQGTVEDIGLRSIRIRTLDRTVLTVPNGQIASMSIEDLSVRDKFWFHPILYLCFGTTTSQMYALLKGIRSLLEESRHVQPDSVRVRFLRLGSSSLDVDVFAYVVARDLNQFLEVQEGLLFRIIECVESSGVQFAFPLNAVPLGAPWLSCFSLPPPM